MVSLMPLLSPIVEYHLDDVQRYASVPRISAMSYVPDPCPADGAIRWYELVVDRIDRGNGMADLAIRQRWWRLPFATTSRQS